MIRVKAYRIRVGKEKFRPGQTITELDPAEEQRLIEEGYAERVPSSDFEQVPEKQEMINTSYPEEQVPGAIQGEQEDTVVNKGEDNQSGEIDNEIHQEPQTPAGNDERRDEQNAASEDTEQTEETDEGGPATSYPAEPPEPEKKSASTSRHRRSGERK